MKNSKIFKTISLTFAILLISGGLFFFSSSSTIEQSNSQAITELSEKLSKMTANLNELKVADAENAIWSEPTIGQIAMFAGNFAPRGWAFCDGSLLPINSNSALFSILGTTYGGDGRTTFGLPDLRGRVAVGAGHGPGLSPVQLGEKFGREQMNIIPQTVSVDASTGNNDKMVVSGILPANNVMQPSLSVNYIIALTGVFPSRS